jgi:hypothetical protein
VLRGLAEVHPAAVTRPDRRARGERRPHAGVEWTVPGIREAIEVARDLAAVRVTEQHRAVDVDPGLVPGQVAHLPIELRRVTARRLGKLQIDPERIP